jgi:hypothetical protein
VLILVTMGLVAVAGVALAVGFVSNHIGPIYLSIACSALAGMVLLLFARLSRQETPLAVGAGTAPLGGDFTTAFPSRLGSPSRFPSSSPTSATAVLPVLPRRDDSDGRDGGGRYGGWAEEPLFPIEDYDELRVADILRLLVELDPDELEEVREREAIGKARATVLTRVRELSDALDAVSGAARVPERAKAPPAKPAPAKRAPAKPVRAGPMPARARPAPAKTAGTGTRQLAAAPFPITDYERLRAPEIVARLPELDDDELEAVAARELPGARRTTILSRLEKLLGRPLQAG